MNTRPQIHVRGPSVRITNDPRFRETEIIGTLDLGKFQPEPSATRIIFAVFSLNVREIEPFAHYTNYLGKCEWVDMIAHTKTISVKARVPADYNAYLEITEPGLYGYKVWNTDDGLEFERMISP